MEREYRDYYQDLLKRLCKANNISLKLRFENIEDMIVINIKNHLKEGVDLDCFKIINFIYQTVMPFNIKYNQTLYLYPGGNRLDRVTISFDKNDYINLNKKLEIGDIN